MKKTLTAVLAATLALCFALSLAACGDNENVITVGASPTPHAEILNAVKEELKKDGWTLVVRTFDDYVTPNTALQEGELDANYFQHEPYLTTFNKDYKTDLVSVGKVHYEPFGIYGKNVTKEDFKQNTTGRTIYVPADGSNFTRALYVLQDEGYITLDENVTASSESLTVRDIKDLKGNEVKPVEAQTVTSLLNNSDDGTIAVVNGNYALTAGYKSENALAFERADGDAAQLYANIIAVKRGNEESAKTKALVKALLSKTVYDFITNTYHGAVRPVFDLEG